MFVEPLRVDLCRDTDHNAIQKFNSNATTVLT